jgi:tetraacyldisaccharide-1-P 4'-kinase
MVFRDHHWFTDADVARIVAAVKSTQGAVVLTTEKDAVRLGVQHLDELRPAVVPLITSIDPPGFLTWLLKRLGKAGLTPEPPTSDARVVPPGQVGP